MTDKEITETNKKNLTLKSNPKLPVVATTVHEK
jgi:hypothetical protein